MGMRWAHFRTLCQFDFGAVGFRQFVFQGGVLAVDHVEVFAPGKEIIGRIVRVRRERALPKRFVPAAGHKDISFDVRAGVGRIDTVMLVYAGRSWMAAENWGEAKEIFTRLKGMNYNKAEVYTSLAKIAVAENDLNKAVSTLLE